MVTKRLANWFENGEGESRPADINRINGLQLRRERLRDVIKSRENRCKYALQRRRKWCVETESQGKKVPIKQKSPDIPHRTIIGCADPAEAQRFNCIIGIPKACDRQEFRKSNPLACSYPVVDKNETERNREESYATGGTLSSPFRSLLE